jgi:hypothetical protein
MVDTKKREYEGITDIYASAHFLAHYPLMQFFHFFLHANVGRSYCLPLLDLNQTEKFKYSNG